MAKLVMLAAVSGAGKTWALDRLDSKWAGKVELDRLIEQLFYSLNVGGPEIDDKYHYDNWNPFLETRQNDPKVRDAFARAFQKYLGVNKSAVLAGNHFQLPAMTEIISRSISSQFDDVLRLFLDVPANVVFNQRKERRTPWDERVTAEQVQNGIDCMRQSMGKQGFVSVNSDEVMQTICRFLTDEKSA